MASYWSSSLIGGLEIVEHVVWLLYASQNTLAYFQGLKQQEGIERVYYDDMFKAKKNKSTGNEWNVSLKQDVNFSFKNIWLVDLVI